MSRARWRGASALLFSVSAEDVPDGIERARAIRMFEWWSRHRRKTVRPRSLVGSRTERGAPPLLRRRRHFPDRPLPRKGARTESSVLSFRQLVPRAGL